MDNTFNIFINGEIVSIKNDAEFNVVLQRFGAQPPFAILLNQHFIPASKHPAIKLQPNDQIEIISAIQGG